MRFITTMVMVHSGYLMVNNHKNLEKNIMRDQLCILEYVVIIENYVYLVDQL